MLHNINDDFYQETVPIMKLWHKIMTQHIGTFNYMYHGDFVQKNFTLH